MCTVKDVKVRIDVAVNKDHWIPENLRGPPIVSKVLSSEQGV